MSLHRLLLARSLRITLSKSRLDYSNTNRKDKGEEVYKIRDGPFDKRPHDKRVLRILEKGSHMFTESCSKIFGTTINFMALLLLFMLAGCGSGSDNTGHWDPDATAPTLIGESPARSATAVPTGTQVTATFNEAMEPTTLTETTFTLGCGGMAIPGSVAYSGVTAVFTPDDPLLENTECTATVTTGATDLAGNPLASNYVWEFTTLMVPDTIHPFVLSTGAANGATGLPINRDSTATFNEPMAPATLAGTSNFTVCPATQNGACTGPNVAGTVSYIGNTATFNPGSDLTPNTWYRSEILVGATDLSGNALVPNVIRANPWWWQTGADADIARPYVSLTAPVANDTGVPLNSTINATFSEEMQAATLVSPATNFTLCSTGNVLGGPCIGADLAGQVDYDPITNIATFIPAAPLLASTSYTARILDVPTGASDLAGNLLNNLDALSKPNPWSFTTGTELAPVAVNLGTAGTFGTFGGSAGMTNTGIQTVLNGNIGTIATGAVNVTGFRDATDTYTITGANNGLVNGTIYTCAPSDTNPVDSVKCAIATQARLDAENAYLALAAMPSDGALAGNLAGTTIYPGVYTNASSVLIEGGNLTLDGGGDANAVFVFQIGSTLRVGGPGNAFPQSVLLQNGAQAKNIFWQVGTSATINAGGGGTMVGNILANSGVTFSTAGNTTVTTLNGRALSLVSSVTMVDTVINVPAP